MAEDFEEKRQRGKQKGIDEAFIQGQKTYNEGIPVLRYLSNQIDKGFTYDGDARKALKDGYNDAKNKEKKNKNPDRLNKKAGGRIKFNKGGMPDLSGDGEVTQKDVLIGRGVIKKKAGGKIKAKKMKKCRMDGIAIRGKTRAKQRSK